LLKKATVASPKICKMISLLASLTRESEKNIPKTSASVPCF
jgi:hypothetical protein